MVKKSMFRVLFAAAALSVASCATNGDIDDLKDQLTELEGQVGQLEQEQQAALLAQISKLEADIAALQGELDGTQTEIAADYDALLASLTDLENEVASGAKVHYGSVLTAEDFDSFLASEATIATGDVVITSNDQLAKLEKLALVGGNLEIKDGGAIALPNLESVSGMLKMDGDATSVSLVMLKSVGKGVSVSNTTALTTVDMPELLLVNGDFISENVADLATLTMAKLDVVAGDLIIDNAIPGSKEDAPYGTLMTMDFSEAHVMGNVELLFLAQTELTTLGNVDGDLNILSVGLTKFVSNATTIGGNIIFNNNVMTSELDFPALVSVGGNIEITNNGSKSCWFFPCTISGELKELTAFDVLETIGGNVEISSNATLEKIETFNKVTAVMGDVTNLYSSGSITISNNGTPDLINVFNKLTTTKDNRDLAIVVEQFASWFIMFNELPAAVSITFENDPADYYKFEAFNTLINMPSSSWVNLMGASEVKAFENVTGFEKSWYLSSFSLVLPFETTTSLCTMSGLLNDINDNVDDEYGTRTGTYYGGDSKEGTMTIAEVVAAYASDCN